MAFTVACHDTLLYNANPARIALEVRVLRAISITVPRSRWPHGAWAGLTWTLCEELLTWVLAFNATMLSRHMTYTHVKRLGGLHISAVFGSFTDGEQWHKAADASCDASAGWRAIERIKVTEEGWS